MVNRIILTGFMGCGKSSLGKAVARRRGILFLDTDALVEQRALMSISEIFEKYGEAKFRQLETETLQQLAESDEEFVLSVGGGLVMNPVNRPILKEIGTVVYLHCSVDELYERLKYDKSRPLLQGAADRRERIEELLSQRSGVYEETADVTVSNTARAFSDVVDELVSLTDGSARDAV